MEGGGGGGGREVRKRAHLQKVSTEVTSVGGKQPKKHAKNKKRGKNAFSSVMA